MNINRRLKVETYPEGEEISGDNWPIAFLGLDYNLNENVAITTDRVRASEFKGTSLEYARVFVRAPELLEKTKEVVDDIYEAWPRGTAFLPQSFRELEKLIDEIEEEAE